MRTESASRHLKYHPGNKARKWWKRIVVAALVLLAAAIVFCRLRWGGTVDGERMMYLQRQCQQFEPKAGQFAGAPYCWLQFRKWLPSDEPSMGGTLIYLHECVRPGGKRFIVALYMRPNIDHSQFCSIDATVVSEGDISHLPHAVRHVVAWVDGWSESVDWNKLGWAQADPSDSSHMVFKYDSPMPRGMMGGDLLDKTITHTPMKIDFHVADSGEVTKEDYAVAGETK